MSVEDDLRVLLEQQRQQNQARGVSRAQDLTHRSAEHVVEGLQRALDGHFPVSEDMFRSLQAMHRQGRIAPDTLLRTIGLDPPTPGQELEGAAFDQMISEGPRPSNPRRGRFQVGRESPPPRYESLREPRPISDPPYQYRPSGATVVSRRGEDGTWTPTPAAGQVPREHQSQEQLIAAANAAANERDRVRRQIENRTAPQEAPAPKEDGPSTFDRLLDDDWI